VSTRERLLSVLESVLGAEALSLADTDGPHTVAAWDSVAHLNLILSIEQEFDLQFETAEIPELRSVGAILARLDAR